MSEERVGNDGPELAKKEKRKKRRKKKREQKEKEESKEGKGLLEELPSSARPGLSTHRFCRGILNYREA